MRYRLNCWIVAAFIFLFDFRSYRKYLWARRSYSFKGAIPHAGNAFGAGWRKLVAIEAIPPKPKLWTPENFLVLFVPRYRVWVLRVVEVKHFATYQAAKTFATRR